MDNGWYASGLIVVRQAMPELAGLVNSLIAPMNFGLFYDNRAETHCNVNPAITGNQPTGQMFGGYYAGLPPDQGDNWTHYYHNGALYSDPRISAYIGMGLHQMPGNVWWRSWRELPPPAPFADCQATDPDFSWQGQWPMAGSWQTYTDPQSGQKFPVWEGHYTYPGSDLTFIPTYSGGMFEGLMPNEIVPETSWGTRSFGLADARTAQVQIKYATQQLHYPVWGMSPSSTPDDTGGYGGYGVEGLAFPYYGTGANASHPNEGLSQCHGCATEDVVTPHASFLALDVAPQQAYANITALRTPLPGRVRGGRLLRRGQPGHRGGRPPRPRARPVDDHGGAGQRAARPRAAARLRARPGVLGRAHVPVDGDDVDCRLTGERGHAPGTVRDKSGGAGRPAGGARPGARDAGLGAGARRGRLPGPPGGPGGGPFEPLDHGGGDVLAVPAGPYADTTGDGSVAYYAVAAVADGQSAGPLSAPVAAAPHPGGGGVVTVDVGERGRPAGPAVAADDRFGAPELPAEPGPDRRPGDRRRAARGAADRPGRTRRAGRPRARHPL